MAKTRRGKHRVLIPTISGYTPMLGIEYTRPKDRIIDKAIKDVINSNKGKPPSEAKEVRGHYTFYWSGTDTEILIKKDSTRMCIIHGARKTN